MNNNTINTNNVLDEKIYDVQLKTKSRTYNVHTIKLLVKNSINGDYTSY